MNYRLKVSFRSNGRTYVPGDILPDGLPAADLKYLKGKGFIEPVDAMFPGGDVGGFRGVDAEDDGLGVSFPDLGEAGLRGVKSPEEIQKMRTKDEVFAYALSIGLDLGDGYKEKSVKELQEQTIDFQGSVEATG